MKRALVTLLAIVLISTLVLVGYRALAGDRGSTSIAAYQTVIVGRHTLVSTVSATGAIAPEQKVALNFKSAGRVAAVYVREGDRVEPGQILAELEAADLVLQVRAARANLAIAEARLEQLLTPPLPSEVAAAEAQLASAQAAYRELISGPDEEKIRLAQVQLEKAQAVLAQAQAAYDQVRGQPNIGALPQSLQLQQATLDYQAAEANYRLTTQSATEAQIAQALAQVAQAQANLDRIRRGASEADIKVAQAQVEQARVQVEQAEYALSNAQIKSPIAGTVAQVNIRVGELTTGNPQAIVVQDESRLPLDVYVDEIDIGRVHEGQAVEVSIDAFGDTTFTGRIASIAPAASLESGVSAYKVTILLDETDAPLRVGMSATAFITVETIENVVAVPNRAVRLDRAAGKAYVNKLMSDGSIAQVEVQLGARNDTLSQILAGVREGDVLVIGGTDRRQQLQGLFGG